MSADVIVTAIIGLVASIYVGRMALASWRRLTAPARGQSACGGCSGCGTTDGHAETEDECEVRASELITLGTRRQAK